MPVPEGQITGAQIWQPVTEQVTKVLPPEEVTEVIVEVESDDE